MNFVRQIFEASQTNFKTLPDDTFKKYVRVREGAYELCCLTYWQDAPNYGNQYKPDTTYDVQDIAALYAKYPEDNYFLMYYYVDGTSEKEKISSGKITLKKPSYSDFYGWWVNDTTLCTPDQDTSLYPVHVLTGDELYKDIIAREQVCAVYTLSYDNSGGTGYIEPVQKTCTRYVQRVSSAGTEHIAVIAESVRLAEGDSYTKVSSKTGKLCIFNGWKIGKKLLSPGNELIMSADYTAFAHWLYQPTYAAIVKQYLNNSERTGCATIVSVDDPANERKKTLTVTDINSVLTFTGWYTDDNKFISDNFSIDVIVSPQVSPSESEYEQKNTWHAKFSISQAATVVSDGTHESYINCVGKLTRQMLIDC